MSSRKRSRRPVAKQEANDLNEMIQIATRVFTSGDAERAVELLSLALQRQPKQPELLELLGRAQLQCGRAIEGLELLDEVVEIGAATAATWRHMADGLVLVGEYAQATGAYQQSVDLEPDDAEARHNFGRALYRLGELEAAAQQLRNAIELADAVESWLALATMAPGCPSFSARQILDTRRELARRLPRLQSNRELRPLSTDRPDRLKLGYLCAFFDQPNYMKPVWALINHHDRERFQLHLFSDTDVRPGDDGYRRHERDCVHDVSKLDNQQLFDLIREQGIEILVDLNAYSTSHRLSLFTERPAPIVVAWFNMYATSGLPGIDYIVGDQHVVRPEEEADYSEQVLRLSQSYLSFEVLHPTPATVPPPCVENGFVTFGSFVTQYKITPQVLDVWSEILRRAPKSRLVLANTHFDSPHNSSRLLDQFAKREIMPSRVQLFGSAPHAQFLEYYNDVDLALDSFPYNGGTTTMEAIWQGVPVITHDGDRWASRTSVTILRDTHLSEFVADSVDGYIALAVRWANEDDTVHKLSTLRSQMRERLRGARACDGAGLAATMEALFDQIAAKES